MLDPLKDCEVDVYCFRDSPPCPEKRLLWAILFRSAIDYAGRINLGNNYATTKKRRVNEIMREAIEWWHSDEYRPFSVLWIIEQLEIEYSPKVLIKRLNEFIEATEELSFRQFHDLVRGLGSGR